MSWLPPGADEIVESAAREREGGDGDDEGDDHMMLVSAARGGEDEEDGDGAEASKRRDPELMHSQIVEYLKKMPREQRATFVDFERELRIDLSRENYVLDMLKSNPKVECERSAEDELSFQYRTKFSIANKRELLETIGRVQCGIISADIFNPECYPGVELDVSNLIVGGDIIACRNRTLKSIVLYPRARPFLSLLSGSVTAEPGKQAVSTSEGLMDEIRRGDAVGIGSDLADLSWYRVSCKERGTKQTERATAPLSVTSDVALSEKNKYCDTYDSSRLPLDGDFDGDEVFQGPAVRHGVPNDIRALWHKTLDATKALRDGDKLRQELVQLKLLTGLGAQQAATLVRPTAKNTGRKKRKARESGRISNPHLRGTAIEEAMKQLQDAPVEGGV